MAHIYGRAWEETPREMIQSCLDRAERGHEDAVVQAEQFESQASTARQKAKGWLKQAADIRAALEKLGPAE